MTGRVAGLNALAGEERMQINPQDAAKLGISSDDTVKVTSPRGAITTQVELTDEVPPGIFSMSFHFADAPVNVLTNPAVCSMSVASEVKVCPVCVESIEKVGAK
ncbi:MAG: hypothetical protein M1571_05320 [Firmicutes bacterium]|nr:hypothetical protein [Bacillota bacterium]